MRNIRRKNNSFIKFDVVSSMVGGGISGEDNGPFEFHHGKTPPTEAEIEAEMDRLEKEWTANEYARNRQAEYPPWNEQLDKIFHDGVAKWKSEMVQPVKDKYPKPE